MKALAHEVGCASVVVRDSLIGGVLASIHLNDEPSAEAAGSGDVGADGNLAPKMCVAYQPPIPPVPPQALFKFMERTPQLSCIRLRLW